jgi:phytoene/squalene synthetase
MTTRYASWVDVLDYCRRSANPVGRLVLRVAGYRNDDLERSSDSLCTALQLPNFWQDFARDWRAGRLYVPRDLQAACGAGEDELRTFGASPGSTPPALGDAWQRTLAECVRLTRDQYRSGRRVCDAVTGRLRYELRLTWLGGQRILDHVDLVRRDLMTRRPTLGLRDWPAILGGALAWART